jgi:autotransporter-associated beta strand protein
MSDCTQIRTRLAPPASRCRLLALAVGLWAVLAASASGQTWNGGSGSNSNWTTGANWVGGTVPFYTNSPYSPAATANVIFNGSTRTTVNVDATPTNYLVSLGFSSTAGSFTLNNGTIGITGNIFSNSANTETVNSNLSLVSAQTWDVSAGKLVLNGVISNAFYGTITKNGAGELDITGNNSFTGPVVVNGGTLRLTNSNALGTAEYGNQINAGATLDLNGGIAVNESDFSFNGTGTSGQGALLSSGGNNTLGGQLNFGNTTAAASIQVSSGTLNLTGSLNLLGNVTWTGAGSGIIGGQVSGSGTTFGKSGTGTLTFSGTSGISNGGGLQIDGGTVVLNHSSGANTWSGPIIVGNNTSAVGSSTLQLGAGEQIADSLTVTINNSGVFNLNGFTETLAAANMTGGSIVTNGGTFALGNSIANITTFASGNIATITGNVQLQAASSNLNVARGTAASDLAINGVISATGTGNIIKNGAGIVVFNGTTANTFGGTALSGSSVIINSGGTLLLGASNQIGASTNMNLAGGSFNSAGFSEGNATTAGLGSLTLSASSTLNLGSGSSTLAFSSSSGSAWTSGQSLSITNWSGNLSGGGTDRIYFGTSNTTLTSTQLSQITFVNPTGLAAGNYGAKLLSSGELVPFSAVPEPSTVAAGAVLGVLATADLYRRRRKKA